MIDGCPVRTKEFLDNVELFGEDGAHAIWLLSDGKNPTKEEAFKLLHGDKVQIVENLQAWDTGTFSGKPEKTNEPIIDKLILSDPNAKVGGGESFQQVKQRAIRAGMSIMKDAPWGAHVVLNSSILKFIMLWDKMGRPLDWDKITPEKYLALHTTPGETVVMKGLQDQKIIWTRHGETDQNRARVLRDEDALLTDKGKEEANKIGEKFSKENIPLLYSSPLPRTLQTADRILQKQPIKEFSYQKQSFIQNPDSRLDTKVKDFIKRSGGNVEHVSDTGQDYAGLVNTINGAIQIVDGKAGIETLAHESIHLFQDLLPDDSKLLADIIKYATNSDAYDEVYERYKNDPEYQKNGKVDETKMAKEVFAQIVDDIFVEKELDRRAKSLWERLWQWIKDFVGRIKEALGGKSFTGENLPVSELVSEEILGGHTGRLSKEKLRKIKEANEKGQIYYEKSPEVKKRIEEIKADKNVGELQKVLVDALYGDPLESSKESLDKMQELGIKPVPVVELESDNHIYSDPKTGEVYKGTTTEITGKFPEDKKVRYKANADAGTTLHKIFEHLVNGKTPEQVMKMTDFPIQFANDVLKGYYVKNCMDIISKLTEDGSVILSEVIVSDPQSKIAGSQDIIAISPKGFIRITDIKSSIRSVYKIDGKKDLSETYTSKWVQSPGSVFNNYVGDKSGKAVLDEDGKLVPKTSEDQPSIKLSKELAHDIQVGTYARMNELQGVPVVGSGIEPFQIDIQDTGGGQFVIKDIKRQETRPINLENNKVYIDAIIPTQVDTNNPSKLQETRPGYDYSKDEKYQDPQEAEELKRQSREQFNEALDKSNVAKSVAEKIIQTISQREQYIKSLNRTKQEPAIKETTSGIIGGLKRDMTRWLSEGKYSTILNEFMDFTIRQSKTTSTYLNDPTKLNDRKFTSVLEQAQKFAESYSYINGLLDRVHSTQVDKFNESVGAVNDLRKSIEDALRNWSEFAIKSMDLKYLTNEIEEYIKGNPEDIGLLTRLYAPHSGTASIGVTALSKLITDAHFRIRENWNTWKDEVQTILDTFHKAIGEKGYKKGMYDFMTNKDGTFVSRESKEQLQKEIDAHKELMDSEGQRKKYVLDSTKPEDIDYNKKLFEDEQYYKSLKEAEQYIPSVWENGRMVSEGYYKPGEFYQYVPAPIYDEEGNITGYNDFEKEREKFEKKGKNGKWKIQFVPDAVSELKWLKEGDEHFEENPDGTKGRKLSENEVRGLAALQYRNKFYNPIETNQEMDFDNDGFTGKVNSAEPGVKWVVKPEFKKMRDISTTGNSLIDPRYEEIMKDPVRKQFYNDYMDKMDKLWLRTSQETREYMKGKIPVKVSSLLTQVMKGDIPPALKLKLIGDNIKKIFTGTYITERQVDESGNIKHSIPIAHTGSFKDQEKINRLKDKIKDLDARWEASKNIATKAQENDYKKERGLLYGELKTEELKIQPYQIEEDLGKALIDMGYAVETFDELSKVESDALAIRNLVAMKSQKAEMAQTDAQGRPLFKKTMNSIGTSLRNLLTGGKGGTNELAMIDDVMDMIFYHAAEYPNSFWSKMEQVPILLAALNSFLINPPTSFGVAALIESIHAKEALVGHFFNWKQYSKSKWIINKAIGEWIANESVKATGGEGKKFGSKVEAWAAKTQAFNKGVSDDAKGLSNALKLEHFVEWSGTIKGAVAIALNTPITGADGTISNCYDIWIQKPNGDVEIPDNYKESWDKMKYKLNRTMADYQNRFHGAYADIEKATITQYPTGKSQMFLHKWIPASIISMLHPRWVHGNLGISEGQLITLYDYVKDWLKYKGDIQEKFEQGYRDMIPKGAIGNEKWNEMSPEERRKADDKAYEDDPNFKGEDGKTDWSKAERDRDTRRMEMTNMRRNLVTAVYIAVAWGAFMLFRSLAQDSDDGNTKRWANFLARTFDRLRKQQLFAMPVVGLEEEYGLLKSPIASLRTMGEFAEAFSATFGLVIPPYGANYYTTGVHKGELKAKVKWEGVIPGLNTIKWYRELNSPEYWLK